ncbi:MAG: VOC family protein [Magnetococcus sp. YQC-5]
MINLDVFEYFGPQARLHHIGMAVKSIIAIAPNAERFVDPLQKVNVAFISVGDVVWELVEPLDDTSPVKNYISSKHSLYHLCLEVPDLEEAVSIAKKQKFYVIRKPKPAVAFQGRRIVWLFHPVLGLFEILEKSHTMHID